MSDRILIDGVDFESQFRHIRFGGWGEMFTAGGLQGANYASPLGDGETWRRKTRAPTVLSLPFDITPAGVDVDTQMAYANTEWFKLLRMFPRRRTVELTREIGVVQTTVVEGEPVESVVSVRQVAEVERVQEVAPSWLAHSYQEGVLLLRNLKGVWYDETPRTLTVNASTDPAFFETRGTTDTGNMTIALTGGTGTQTLTNVSAGVSLSYNWDGVDPASEIRVDVPAFTVHRVLGASTVVSLSRFSHSPVDPRFMVVDPDAGVNEFTITSGQAVLSIREAWL